LKLQTILIQSCVC